MFIIFSEEAERARRWLARAAKQNAVRNELVSEEVPQVDMVDNKGGVIGNKGGVNKAASEEAVTEVTKALEKYNIEEGIANAVPKPRRRAITKKTML